MARTLAIDAPFELLREISRGEGAAVFAAFDPATDRAVTLVQVVPGWFDAGAEELLAAYESAGDAVVRIFAADRERGWVVTEPPHTWLADSPRTERIGTRDMLRQMLATLGWFHARGLSFAGRHAAQWGITAEGRLKLGFVPATAAVSAAGIYDDLEAVGRIVCSWLATAPGSRPAGASVPEEDTLPPDVEQVLEGLEHGRFASAAAALEELVPVSAMSLPHEPDSAWAETIVAHGEPLPAAIRSALPKWRWHTVRLGLCAASVVLLFFWLSGDATPSLAPAPPAAIPERKAGSAQTVVAHRPHSPLIHAERLGDGPARLELVLVAPQEFDFGVEASRELQPGELPARRVKLERPYYISTTEVTWRQFAEYASGHPAVRAALARGEEDLPATGLGHQEAKDFCLWLSPEGGLPTEMEWECAARSGDRCRFPWGDGVPPDAGRCRVRFSSTESGTLVRAEELAAGANLLGLRHLLGNAAEWCADDYAAGHGDEPGDPGVGEWPVIRGASYLTPASQARLTWRACANPAGVADVGFRVVIRCPASSVEDRHD